ncbi:transposase [Phaeodactylibacter xiamenensis]|uniref:transposase n=1 Tax=Phaeodactylibacter xiamenensis TaxID=1524460 RepID=UPI0024A80DFA|nr:transposase [Phaeodactylibacter xiamenensis]
MSRRNFNAEFKTKVVLEALKEVNTLAEIAKKHKLYPQQIATWKKEFLSGASSVFHKGKATSAKSEAELEKDRLMRKIGEQAIEIDFLKKRLP